jgi:DNA-binding HxlR family transcriptional regulator
MSNDGYNLFCPIAKACEIIEPRWTLLVLAEMWSGSTRFNDIRRGVPGMSPTLLSKRLKELEHNGMLVRLENPKTGEINYELTEMAIELETIGFALGKWANRHIDSDVTLEKLDARLLMWNMRRKINIAKWPKTKRTVVQFSYPELPLHSQNYWLVSKPGSYVDLCTEDPGQDVDLLVTADLRAMTAAWMGYSSLAAEVSRGKITLIGDRTLAQTMSSWMIQSAYAEAC